MPADFEQMWRDLAPVGRSDVTGGYLRQPFTAAERECLAWFVEQAESRDLEVERDGIGNVVAWWRPEGIPRSQEHPDLPGDGALGFGVSVLTGSHLDSVVEGGAYDGPLGVVSALAAVDRMREQGTVPDRPLGIGVFCEEEGSRFGLACLGSRLAAGTTTPAHARTLRDRAGVRLEDAMAAAGLEPDLGPSPLLSDVGCFVELHVEQGRYLVDRDAPVGLASGIWPHGRYRFDFAGRADHAGTTRMEDRHDPMLGFAMTALAANKRARLSGQRATFGRVEVAPNGTNAIPSRVTGWLDARADTEVALAELVAEIEQQATERAGRDGTMLTVTPESVSGHVAFDAGLTRRLGEALGAEVPVIATQAGHDAGILAAAGVPTAMLFVRNPTGVSHSPEEHAGTADCLAGVDALATVLHELTR